MAFRPARGRGPRGDEDRADPTGSVRERAVRRQRRGLLVTLVVGVLAVAATWTVAFSPLLATRTVDVQGVSLLTPVQVAEAAKVPLGVPLLRQDLRAIATGVRSLAPVREVDVVLEWPHTLGIRVAERTPVVAFVVNGGYMLVDGEGVAYARVPELPEDVLLARGTAQPRASPQQWVVRSARCPWTCVSRSGGSWRIPRSRSSSNWTRSESWCGVDPRTPS